MSTRRVMSDVRDARFKALLDCIPSPASIFRYMEDPSLTAPLDLLIVRSSQALRTVEMDFAVDSSGFSSSVFSRWFDVMWGKDRKVQEWVKANVMTGVKTNVVTAVSVTPGHTGDAPELPKLLETTFNSGFDIREVSADMAYLSKKNLQAINDKGAGPYIPFKSNSVPGQPGDRNYDPLWDRLYHYYCLNQDEFGTHYHKRSNVESTFSMAKGKFGNSVRTKLHEAQVNEVLATFLCHNICVLIRSVYQLGKAGIAPEVRQLTCGIPGDSGVDSLFDAYRFNGAGGIIGANGTNGAGKANGATSVFDVEWPVAPQVSVNWS